MAKEKVKTKKAARTASRAAFEKNAARAASFFEIHKDETRKRRGAPTGPFRELPRGAVVFAVCALNAYLSEVSAEILIKQLQSAPGSTSGRDVLKRVQKELPGLALEASLLPSVKEWAERIRQAVTEFFHDHVSQHGPRAVSDTVARLGGDLNRVWTTIDAAWPKSRRLLQDWTDARHRIVHQGKSEPIRRPDADDCIKLIRKIVEAVDAESLKASASP